MTLVRRAASSVGAAAPPVSCSSRWFGNSVFSELLCLKRAAASAQTPSAERFPYVPDFLLDRTNFICVFHRLCDFTTAQGINNL